MSRILHISDLHFGPYLSEKAASALTQAAHSIRPDLICVTGDFTQRAKRRQFEDAREFLTRLPDVPLLAVPGNHDVPLYRIPERLAAPYRLYRRYICPKLEYVRSFERLVAVCLNTTSPLRRITNGRIRPAQLTLCEKAFASTPADWIRLVVAHHQFAPTPDYERVAVMRGARRALEVFARSKVDLILGGHLHRAYIGNSLDVFPTPGQRKGIIIVQAGTATSRRGRAREQGQNSFNVITTGAATIRVHHYLYSEKRERFLPTSRHVFLRGETT